jgi:Undecaprenyl-phosphate glucose phosphotransferase
MLKKHGELFKNLFLFFDLAIISLIWVFAYYLRFYIELIPIFYDFSSIEPYLLLLFPLLLIWVFVFKAFNLYRPRRLSSRFAEILDITKACTLTVIILVSLTFFLKKFEFSRLVFLYFWIFSIAALSFSRIIFRGGLSFLRRKGYNLRHVVIVGDGILARELIKRLRNHPEVGINILGLLGNRPEKIGSKVHGEEILGTYGDIETILNQKEVDQVFIATPFVEISHLETIFNSISNYPVTIKIIPDIHHFPLFCAGVEEFSGLPILSIQDSPLYGWNVVFKRLLDFLTASFAIVLTLPLMAAIAVVIKLTSPGPVFYRQKRAGLDGKIFNMLKFRTMHVDAEKGTGPVWASENDPRRTKFGALLRRTSLDELPQFFNVFKGDMSVVGPRPERTEFIEEFKEHVPRYLLRHKMKAGITGWAQIKGWRGNTSLKERIKHDLYYIENWSIWFDIKIMWLTVWNGFINKHAY